MEDLIYEIIIGAVILGIVVGVIFMFRQGASVMKGSVSEQQNMQDVKVEEIVGLDGEIYKASKIKEAIEFAKISDVYVQVVVKTASSTKLLWPEDDAYFDPNVTYDTTKKYKLDIEYYSSRNMYWSSDNLLPDNTLKSNVQMIRFVFSLV